jgi:hypothetical protein
MNIVVIFAAGWVKDHGSSVEKSAPPILPMIPKVIDSWGSPSSLGQRYNISLSSATLKYGRQNKNQGFRGHKSGFP